MIVDVTHSLAGAWNAMMADSKGDDDYFWKVYNKARDVYKSSSDNFVDFIPYPELGNFVKGNYGLIKENQDSGEENVVNGLIVNDDGTIVRQITDGEVINTWTIEKKPVNP